VGFLWLSSEWNLLPGSFTCSSMTTTSLYLGSIKFSYINIDFLVRFYCKYKKKVILYRNFIISVRFHLHIFLIIIELSTSFFFFFFFAYVRCGYKSPVCLLESSFFLESEFRESIFRCLVV